MKGTLLAALAAAAVATPALSAGPAFAPEPAPPVVVLDHALLAAAEAPRAQADAWKRWADDFSRDMRASMGTMYAPRMGSGKVVKGAPYSAEVVTEATQSLADGNVISRRTSGMVYRDGEGRTRQETGAEGKERSVFISDPVAGKHVILTPGTKRAVVTGAAGPRVTAYTVDREDKHKQVVRLGATEIRVEDGKVYVNGRETTGRVDHRTESGKHVVVENGRITIDGKEPGKGDGAGSHVVVKTIDAGDGTRREEVRVHVLRTGDDVPAPMPPIPPIPPTPPGPALAPLPMPPTPPIPGVHTMRFESTAKLGKGVTTSLGAKEFDGVRAEGKSTVWTIPAGQIGNRNPINVTSETWYAPDLQATVYSRYSDPRTGETVYRLAGIRRGEPAPDLFQVPEDYRVRERGERRPERK